MSIMVTRSSMPCLEEYIEEERRVVQADKGYPAQQYEAVSDYQQEQEIHDRPERPQGIHDICRCGFKNGLPAGN